MLMCPNSLYQWIFFPFYIFDQFHNFCYVDSFCLVVTLCSDVVGYQHLQRSFCLHLQGLEHLVDYTSPSVANERQGIVTGTLASYSGGHRFKSLLSFPLFYSVPPSKCWENTINFFHIFFHFIICKYCNSVLYDVCSSKEGVK
jgi:hypothetical protein